MKRKNKTKAVAAAQRKRDELAEQRGKFSRRSLLVGAGQLGLFGVLGWRLHQLQVIDAPKYALLAEENRIDIQLIAPVRGAVYDRFGEALADNVDSLRVVIIPGLVKDMGETLDLLGGSIEITHADRARAIRLAKRQSSHIPIVVAEQLSWQQFAKINVLAPGLPGIKTDIASQRSYRHGAAMAHVVGYVGAANEEEAEDHPVMRMPGFRIGKSGVERGFDQTLRGRAGNLKLEVNARGQAIRKLHTVAADRGDELVTTVDHEIQTFAMQRISGERRAAVVALDAQTGDILALASAPTFDPNTLVDGITAKEWRALTTAKDDPMTCKATRGQYPPGSTFKMVTSLAGLEAGAITPKSRISCRGGFSYANHYWRCWRRGGHGSVNLHNGIKQSCDTFHYEVSRRIGIEKISAMGRKLGLGRTYDCGLPLLKPGVMPTPRWKLATLGVKWYGGETISCAIGQGYVLTTPLQLAVMTARIASGRQIEPRIVRPRAGEPDEPAADVEISKENLTHIRNAMAAVVNEGGGTAGRARLPIEGVQMAGKTGTSQVSKQSVGRGSFGVKWALRDHGLFVAYAPVDKPRYAVAVIVEHGGSGSRAAAPVARDVMTELINRDPLAKPVFISSSDRARTARDERAPGEG